LLNPLVEPIEQKCTRHVTSEVQSGVKWLEKGVQSGFCAVSFYAESEVNHVMSSVYRVVLGYPLLREALPG
jgi:hypothetical protein